MSTKLDADQVIKSIYDENENRIRVGAEVTATIGEISVIIDQTSDSIKLGDGTNLFTSTSINSKQGLDVNQINDSSSISTPHISNQTLSTAGTEASFVIPAGTKSIFLKARGTSTLQFSYISGQSGTTYITVPQNSTYSLTNLNLTSTLTLYFQANTNSEIIEIEYWS